MKHLLALAVLAALVSSACIPTGVHVFVSPNGCLSTGYCPALDANSPGGTRPANYYWAPLREIVVKPDSHVTVIIHEFCHAHQHQVVLAELGIEPDTDLHQWYDTTEARRFNDVVRDTWPRPWSDLSNPTNIEDFATSCMVWFYEPDFLWDLSPERAAFMEADLR